MQATTTNRLAKEASPYLRQHAYNPVKWYPWGDEALKKAALDGKPLIVSIGYSACHWCHVMARESFSNPEIAALMNRYFVNIKVDREERPDLDQVYQTACHLLTRSGGWPLTVFTTPDGRPFYAGTYFPQENFKDLLSNLGQAFESTPEKFQELATELTEAMKESFQVSEPAGEENLKRRLVSIASAGRTNLARHFDWEHGGFGGAPKFPSLPILEYFWAGSPEDKKQVVYTLEKMLAGGIFDQVGGGFHRYATDERWLIPHFEKMLYDNALLLELMAKVFLETGSKLIQEGMEMTAEFVLSELTGPTGEFYASLDADSEGQEGEYYLWSQKEIQDLLEPELAADFVDYFGVTQAGNFEAGKSVLFRREMATIPEKLRPALVKLKAARSQRERPFRDGKIITAWNALMISAFAHTYQALKKGKYLQAAEAGLHFLHINLTREEGEILQSYLDEPGDVLGFSADYAFLIAGLIDLYEVTKNESYLAEAVKLQADLIAKFYDQTEGGFYLVEDFPDLIIHPKEILDGALPAAAGIALLNLQRLSKYQRERASDFAPILQETFKLYLNAAAENPWGYATFLRAAEKWEGEEDS